MCYTRQTAIGHTDVGSPAAKESSFINILMANVQGRSQQDIFRFDHESQMS